MTTSQLTKPWQFSLAQLTLGVTAVAIFCGVLVSSAPMAIKMCVIGAAMIALFWVFWILGRKLTTVRSLWIQAIGELIMSFSFGFGFLCFMYECIAVAVLAAYLSVR